MQSPVTHFVLLLALFPPASRGQHPFFPNIWWKGCDLDVRYNSAWDEHGGIHVYQDQYLGGWRVDEVTKFAEAGDTCMQGILGQLYQGFAPANFVGQPPTSYTQAAKWYRMAAEQGHGDAQESIAGAYLSGVGVRQDYVEAAKWYGKAADQGIPCAQLQLGEMYRDGQGVNEDKVLAHAWMNIASADAMNLGLSSQSDEAHKDYCVKTAETERNTLAQSMTPAQIAQAQALAREWKPHLSADPIPKRVYNMALGKKR